MKNARRLLIGVLVALVVATPALHAQTFTAQIQQFWNLLRTGRITFSVATINPSGVTNPGFPLYVSVNQPVFGAPTAVRFENTDTGAGGSMGLDVLSGNVFFRVLVKNQNFAGGPAVLLASNGGGNTVDLSLGAVNLAAWKIKAGTVQGAPLGNLLAATNNQFDIGDLACTGCPRSIFSATSMVSPTVNATTGFQINGAAGATHAACSTSVTAITVTGGIITAITCT